MSQSYIYSDDPYERFVSNQNLSKNLISNDRSTKFARKYKDFKNYLVQARTNIVGGAIQGFMIGCLAGFGIGLISTFQTKRLVTIPLTMIGSGVFFACVMGAGSIIRTADHDFMEKCSSEEHNFEEYELVKYIEKCQSSLNKLEGL